MTTVFRIDIKEWSLPVSRSNWRYFQGHQGNRSLMNHKQKLSISLPEITYQPTKFQANTATPVIKFFNWSIVGGLSSHLCFVLSMQEFDQSLITSPKSPRNWVCTTGSNSKRTFKHYQDAWCHWTLIDALYCIRFNGFHCELSFLQFLVMMVLGDVKIRVRLRTKCCKWFIN